ncbi:MAG: hypothetical protein K6G00_00280 [Treponema sp.]|nr:hypothetical protein [Treponema sp.]
MLKTPFRLLSLIAFMLAINTSILFAVPTTTMTFNGLTIDVPTDLVSIIEENRAQIEQALQDNSVTQDKINSIQTAMLDAYSKLDVSNPYTTTTEGIDDFMEVLKDVFPNTQMQQNVWAESLISYNKFGDSKGKDVKYKKFGGGINTGVSRLDIGCLLDTANALGMDVGDFPRTLVMPTIAVDARVGMFPIPLDFGLNFCTFDTTAISALDDALDGSSFNFLSIGGDVRYAFIVNKTDYHLTVSAIAGGAYNKGGVTISDDSAKAKLDFNTATFYIGAQASAKMLVFVPFVGTRLLFGRSSISWSVDANWDKILDKSGDESIANAINWNILPKRFSGKLNSPFAKNIRPQMYGGIGLDVAIVSLTLSGCYDFIYNIPSAAFSMRLVF